MAMTWAVIGSRDYPHIDKVARYIETLAGWGINGKPPVDRDVLVTGPRVIVVSGGARGVDAVAAEYAEELGLGVDILPADWSAGNGAGFSRNVEIVRRSQFLTAFWDGMSSGTVHSIVLARQKDIPITVYVGLVHLPTPRGEPLPAAITRVYDELLRRRPDLPQYVSSPDEARFISFAPTVMPAVVAVAKKATRKRK